MYCKGFEKWIALQYYPLFVRDFSTANDVLIIFAARTFVDGVAQRHDRFIKNVILINYYYECRKNIRKAWRLPI